MLYTITTNDSPRVLFVLLKRKAIKIRPHTGKGIHVTFETDLKMEKLTPNLLSILN